MYRHLLLILFLIPVSALTFAAPGKSKHVKARLLLSHTEVMPGESLSAGVEFEITPGWHIYWKNPGDSGLPTRVEWKLPEGFSANAPNWPIPERHEFSGMMNYGYKDRVILTSLIQTPSNATGTHPISANLKWLVCNDICLPGSATVKGEVRVGDRRVESTNFEKLNREQSKHPKMLAEADYRSELEVRAEEIEVAVYGFGFGDVKGVFPVSDRVVLNASIPQVDSTPEGLKLKWQRDPQGVAKVKEFNFVVITEKGSYELLSRAHEARSIVWVLLLAFLGGLLLNLMPCVFPVLSIKAMSIVKKAAKSPKRIQRDGAFYSLGVVSFFLLIGLGLVVLRATGEQLGWGYQLQSSGFVIFISLFILFLGLNLVGTFELPIFGLDLTRKSKGSADIESFITGAVAVLIATPCTAPFMGSALGYAVSQPALVALLVFLFLGLGMSLPYWLIGFFPRLIRLFPKPGPWMQTLKEFLAFPLFLTVGWLIWVLMIQLGIGALPPMIAAVVLLIFFVWLSQKFRGLKQQGVILFLGFVFSWILATLAVPDQKVSELPTKSDSSVSSNGIDWGVYSSDAVTEALSEGKMVFVNFTAAWCLTCKVNEKVTFSSSRVLEKIRDYNIVMLKADWTNHDPVITDILLRHGRAGIPFYLLYRKLNSKPEVLPEVLTPGVFIQALKKENP